MPSLILFAPCDIYTRDAETNLVSIINVKESVTVAPLVSDAESSEQGGTADKWAVVGIWRHEPGDEEKEFEAQISLNSPSEEKLFETVISFDVKSAYHRISLRIRNFPIRGAGIYNLIALLREVPSGEWREAGRFPMEVFIREQQEAEQMDETE